MATWDSVASLLRYSSPVALAAVGETVVEVSGIINIGLEGMMLAGAYAAVVGSLQTGNPWIGVLYGVGAGIAFALVNCLVLVYLRVDQVLAGTAMNLLSLGLTSTLFRARFGQSGQLISAPEISRFAGVDVIIIGLAVLVLGLHFLIRRSGWGLALRACGEYPSAARASGYSVEMLRCSALLIGGLFGGLAGAYLSIGIAGSFAENMTSGRGFVAIALVTFGRWRTPWVLAAALLIGYAESLQYSLQGTSSIPYQFFLALPYLIALAVLVFVGKGAIAPESLGNTELEVG
ncbi:MAG: ABC transporter permease [Armatimonadetes bacterium]|nr:ABC transporter permease [Armatimonadota bacterium]